MMSLTRGVNALFPCPTCLVPKGEIPNLSVRHRLRLTQEMQAVWTEGLAMNATDRENHLQSYGLRDVQVMFQIIVILSSLWQVWITFFSERIWGLRGVDVYSALSWDCLHAYHGGLFSDHILVEIRAKLSELRGRAEADIDERYVIQI